MSKESKLQTEIAKWLRSGVLHTAQYNKGLELEGLEVRLFVLFDL